MFGSGPDYELREYVQEHVISSAALSAALASLLVEKGIFTQEEFERRVLQMKAACDQEYQAMKEEAGKS